MYEVVKQNVYFTRFMIQNYHKGHQMIFILYFQCISDTAFVKYIQLTHTHAFTHTKNKIQFYSL